MGVIDDTIDGQTTRLLFDAGSQGGMVRANWMDTGADHRNPGTGHPLPNPKNHSQKYDYQREYRNYSKVW